MHPVELEEPEPWRSPVPFLWLVIVMLVTGAIAALLTGAADPPAEGEARARIAAAAGSVTTGDFRYSLLLEIAEFTTTMEGRYDADTGRMGSVTTTTGPGPFTAETVTDGRTLYVRVDGIEVFKNAAGGKPWARLEFPDIPAPAAPGSLLTDNPLERFEALGQLRAPIVRVGEERVRGVETVHYRTSVARVRKGVTLESDVDVWLDGDDRFRRVRESSLSNVVAVTSTLDVFDVGVPVTVDLPPEDQVGPFDESLLPTDRD